MGSASVPHIAAVTFRPHTPEVIRGVCSFDMAAEKRFCLVYSCGKKETNRDRFKTILKQFYGV